MKEDVAFIKNLLRSYRKNKSELNELIKAKESLEEQLKYYNEKTVETKDELIEGLSLQSVKLSHIPRSVTNRFNSSVENIVMSYDRGINPTSYDLTNIAKAYIEVNRRIKEIEDDLQLSDNLMEILEDRKKFVIKHKYIHGYTLSEITILHNQTFPIPKEMPTLETLKFIAENEMAKWYNKIMGG